MVYCIVFASTDLHGVGLDLLQLCHQRLEGALGLAPSPSVGTALHYVFVVRLGCERLVPASRDPNQTTRLLLIAEVRHLIKVIVVLRIWIWLLFQQH